MTTSGTYNRQMTAEQMVQAACEDLGYLAAGETATAADLNVGMRQLNWLLKSLTARGANLWREKQIPVEFPAGSASVALDDSIENITAAGVVTGTGFVRELYRYERGEFAMPMNVGQQGVPTGFYVDRQRDAATMYLWPIPATDTTVYADALYAIQDVTEPDETVDVPLKWTEAIYSALAARLAGPFGVTRSDPATAARVEQRAAAFEQLLLSEDQPSSIYMGASGNNIGSNVPRFVLQTPITPPLPSFTTPPSITTDGTPTVGEPLIGVDGMFLNGTVTEQAWLLSGTVVATGPTFTPITAGDYQYRVTLSGLGGIFRALSAIVKVVLQGTTPPPAPPAFTSSPSITSDGTPQVGEQLIGVDGTVINLGANSLVRAWLLGGAVVSNAAAFTPTQAGNFTFRNQVVTSSGTVLASASALVAVSAATPTPTPTPTLQRLALAQPARQGDTVSGLALTNWSPGIALSTTSPGVTVDSTDGTISGTFQNGSALIKSTLANGLSLTSLVFVPHTGTRKMRVGINLAPFNYYTPNSSWLNVLKASQINVPPATADANGVPQTLGSGPAIYYFPIDDGTTTPVTYQLLTDGDYDVTIEGYGAGGGSATFAPDSNGNLIATYTGKSCLTPGLIGRVKLTRIGTGKTPTYWAIVRAEDVADWKAWKAGTRGHQYKTSLVTEMARFSRIRFMPWSLTNWPFDVPTVASAMSYVVDTSSDHSMGSFDVRVPLAAQVDLCIAADCDMWQSVHCTISDADFRAMWPQFNRLLAAGRKVYIEYSNEMWNGQFYQANTYAPQQFDALPGATIDNPAFKKVWWASYRIAQLAKLARGQGYDFVIGCQTESQDNPYGQPRYVDQGLAFANGTYADFTAWHINTYASGSWGKRPGDITQAQYDYQKQIVSANDFDAAIDDICNFDGQSSFSTVTRARDYWAQARLNANSRGLRLVAYEGNGCAAQSVGVGGTPEFATFDQFLYDAAYSAPSAGAQRQALEAAEAAGFDEVMLFDFDSRLPQKTSIAGVFGLFGHPGYDGVKAYLARPYAVKDDVFSHISAANDPARADSVALFMARANIVSADDTPLANRITALESRS